MSNLVCIYALCEPDEPWNIRYVGKVQQKDSETYSQSIERRLQQHLYPSKLRKDHRASWIKSLKTRNLVPCYELLDVGTEEAWVDLEKFYISSFKQAGFRLVNTCAGGENPPSHKGKRRSAETLLRMSQSRKGCILPPEQVAKAKATKLLRSYTPWNKGKHGYVTKPCTEERRENIRNGTTGVRKRTSPLVDARNAKASERMRGNKYALGHKDSKETRAKKSAAQKARQKELRERR